MDEQHDLRYELDDLSMAYARLQAERDAARKALSGLIEAADSGEWHLSEDCDVEGRTQDCGLCQALSLANAALSPVAALTRAITQALTRDPRDVVTVYAEVVQDGPWKPVWDALSVRERAEAIDAARKEAGR